jgi:hypothetical protein
MRRIKIVGLCLVAVFALGAVLAGTASAANPEYGRCIKEGAKKVNNYDNSKCLKLASEDPGTEAEKIKKGSFVWHSGVPAKSGFTAALKPSTIATLETKAGTKVTCKGLSGAGKYTGLKTVTIQKTDFTECESGGIKCNTTGAGTGVIKVKELDGELGVITKGSPSTKDKIGNALWPVGGTATSGSELVEFACGGLTVKVKNSVISPVSANAMKLAATVKFTAAKGVQKPKEFVGGPPMFLESKFSAAPYEQSGQSATTIQTNEEKVEIRSL